MVYNGQHATLRFGFPRSLFPCEDMPACVVNSSSIHYHARTVILPPAGHHGSTMQWSFNMLHYA
jgi:hypothetical protein